MSEIRTYPFADLALARRLERAEAQANLEFVEARARTFPASRAQHLEVEGAHAMFDGVESPLTQTFCLGLAEPLTGPGLAKIEAFYAGLGAPAYHEVSPLADPSALALLNEFGYEPFEFTSVMFRPIARGRFVALSGEPGGVSARLVREEEKALWADTFLRGWGEAAEMAAFMRTFAEVSARKTSGRAFLAELDGQPIAAANLSTHEGVALLAGASTVPDGRRRGAQNALLDVRLRFAAEIGCDLAMMGALPGSSSQRNAERHGFRIAYTRIKWRKAVTYTAPPAS